MRSDDRFMLFTKYLQLGKKGKMRSFDTRLLELGIGINSLRYDYITSCFHDNPHLAVDWEEEIKDIAAKIGFSLSKERVYHIPILGHTKSGKTLFVKLVEDMLQSNKIKVKYVNARDFPNEEKYITEYEKLLEMASNYDIIIVDDIWAASDETGKIKEIMESMDSGALITVWKYLNYYEKEEKILRNIGTTLQEVKLKPLKSDLSDKIFEGIWSVIKAEDIKNEEEKKEKLGRIFCRIFDATLGFTGISILLFVDMIKKFCIEEWENLEDFVEMELKNYTFDKIGDLKKDQVKMSILKILLLSKDSRGVTPSEIAERIRKDSATVTYHLSKLKREGFVEDYRFGKNIFYHVRDIYAPFFEQITMEWIGSIREVIV